MDPGFQKEACYEGDIHCGDEPVSCSRQRRPGRSAGPVRSHPWEKTEFRRKVSLKRKFSPSPGTTFRLSILWLMPRWITWTAKLINPSIAGSATDVDIGSWRAGTFNRTALGHGLRD